MNEDIALLTKEKSKTTTNKWGNADILRAWYSVYKNLGQFFFHTYSLTCLNKNTTVLVKVINICTSS